MDRKEKAKGRGQKKAAWTGYRKLLKAVAIRSGQEREGQRQRAEEGSLDRI